jgi:hypothetical protein
MTTQQESLPINTSVEVEPSNSVTKQASVSLSPDAETQSRNDALQRGEEVPEEEDGEEEEDTPTCSTVLDRKALPINTAVVNQLEEPSQPHPEPVAVCTVDQPALSSPSISIPSPPSYVQHRESR